MKKKGLEAILFIAVVIIGIIIKVLTEIASVISNNMKPLLIIFITVGLAFSAYQIFIIMYFGSNKFNAIKNNISEYTKNCNELNHYIQELKCSYVNIKSYDFGQSSMLDNSNYNFKRKEWSKDIKSNEIHHCSAAVCKKC